MTDAAVPASPSTTLWRLVRPAPRLKRVVLLAVLVSLTEGFGIVMLVPVLALADGGSMGDVRIGGVGLNGLAGVPLAALLGLVLLLVLIRLLVNRASQAEQMALDHHLVDAMRRDIHAGILRAEWQWIAMQRSADLVSMLVTQIGNVGHGLRSAIALIGLVCSLLVYTAAAMLVSWQTTLVAGAVGALAFVASHGQRKRATRFGQSIAPVNRAMHRQLQESVAAARGIKVVGAEDAEIDALARIVGQLRAMQHAYRRDISRSASIRQLTSALLAIGVVGFGITYARLPMAVLLPLLFVFVRLVSMLDAIQYGWQTWLETAPAVAAAEALRVAVEREREPAADANAVPLRCTTELRLESVTVRFAGRDRPALDGVDLVVPAHTTTAIVGPSGAGKSTIADILMGLIEPDSGLMRVDGIAVEHADRLRWRASVAYVEQDARLHNGTIRSNLLAATPDASGDAIHAVLEAASAGFVLALPHGLDTQVGDNGVRLSGGERQRIALARALLAEPQLLILDEATNALDAANEAAIQAALRRLRGRTTIVIISHGAAMLEAADRIVRIEAGKVVPGAAGQPAARPG